MKYLKSFEGDLVKDILELNYILEDENISFEFSMDNVLYYRRTHEETQSNLESSGAKNFNMMHIKVYGKFFQWDNLDGVVNEYYDRVKSICTKYKFNCHKNRWAIDTDDDKVWKTRYPLPDRINIIIYKRERRKK